LDVSQFVQTPHSRGMMRVGSSENSSFHVVKFEIDVGSIQLVGMDDIAGIDRTNMRSIEKQVFLVYRE